MILLSKWTVVAFLVIATAIVASPARALDSGDVAKACAARGSDCAVGVKDNGVSEFCFKNTDGVDCVTCPRPPGACTASLKGQLGPGPTRLSIDILQRIARNLTRAGQR